MQIKQRGKFGLIIGMFFLGLFFVGSGKVFAAAQSVTDTYTDTSKIDLSRTTNFAVSGGQLSVGSGANLGNGADGAITVPVGTTKNINTDIIAGGRSYADGIYYSVTAIGSNTVTTAAAPNGIVAGDEVILINLQGDATNYGNVGNYEYFRITSVNGTTLTLSATITKIYGATNSNSVLTGQDIQLQRVPNYTNVTVSGASTVFTATAWTGAGGGVFAFRANGTVTVGSGSSITMTGKGFTGGAAGTEGAGESYDGKWGAGGLTRSTEPSRGGGRSASQANAAPADGVPTGAGGGGGEMGDGEQVGAGGGAGGAYGTGGGGGGASGASGGSGGASGGATVGGGGGGPGWGGSPTYGVGGNAGSAGQNGSGSCWGYGGAAGSGTTQASGGGGCNDHYRHAGGGGGGSAYGSANLSKIYLGSGGGAGGNGYTTGWGGGYAGGNGGGIIIVSGSTVSVSGSITSGGTAGGSTVNITHSGGGGGGSGGSIYIEGGSLGMGTSLVTALGAIGGLSNGFQSGGGSGGVGRIKTVSSIGVTGTTNPTFSSTTVDEFASTAVIVSKDLLTGISADSVNTFVYNLTKPAGATAVIQFSSDLVNWYSAANVLNGSTTLVVGANASISLSALTWAIPFYYKVTFGTNGIVTPVLTDVTVNYSSDISCDPLPGGNHTIFHSCTFPVIADGADLGTGSTNSSQLIIKSGNLTINTGQTVAAGSIKLSGGAIYLAASGATLSPGKPIWMIDTDTGTPTGDGYPDTLVQYIQTASPSGGKRRNLMTSITVQDCSNTIYSTINQCVAPVPWYRDADGDGKGNPSVMVMQGTPGPAGYVSNSDDCYDANANAWLDSPYCGTVDRGDTSFDYNCRGSAVPCDPKATKNGGYNTVNCTGCGKTGNTKNTPTTNYTDAAVTCGATGYTCTNNTWCDGDACGSDGVVYVWYCASLSAPFVQSCN